MNTDSATTSRRASISPITGRGHITLQRSLDPTAGEVEVFPQDITRVLLNLISNGFYAATKRKAQGNGGDYEPTLTASTKNLVSRPYNRSVLLGFNLLCFEPELASSLASRGGLRAPERFHQSCCWLGGGMAAHGARAADGEGSADRLPIARFPSREPGVLARDA